METTRASAEPSPWRRRPRRDETPFRLDNLHDLARSGPSRPACSPPPPDVTWMTDVRSPSATLFSVYALPRQPARPAPRARPPASGPEPEHVPELDLVIDLVGCENAARRSRRLVFAANATLIAAVLALVALAGVLLTEPRLAEPARVSALPELQVLPVPAVAPAAVPDRSRGLVDPAGEHDKVAVLTGAAVEIASQSESGSLAPR